MIYFLGIKHNNVWLSPSNPVPRDDKPLELRLRFKTPDPNRLKKYDERAFDYYYAQVRHDFDASIVTKNTTQELLKEIEALAKPAKWYVPIIPTKSTSEEVAEIKKRRIALLGKVCKLATLNITIDIMTDDVKDKKDVFNKFDSYIPSGIFDDIQEKAIGMGKLKGKCSEHVDKNLSRNLTLKHLKDDFLMVVEEEFPKYYEEIYQG